MGCCVTHLLRGCPIYFGGGEREVLWRSGGTLRCEGTTRRLPPRQLAATTRSPPPLLPLPALRRLRLSATRGGRGSRRGAGLGAVGVASPPPINRGARPPASGPAEQSGAERSRAAPGSPAAPAALPARRIRPALTDFSYSAS